MIREMYKSQFVGMIKIQIFRIRQISDCRVSRLSRKIILYSNLHGTVFLVNTVPFFYCSITCREKLAGFLLPQG